MSPSKYDKLDTQKPAKAPARTLPEDADPALLAWAREKETVQPGQDGTLPAMDRGGFGIQSMVWGGPMQTGEASVREKEQRRRETQQRKMLKEGEEGTYLLGGGGIRHGIAREVVREDAERGEGDHGDMVGENEGKERKREKLKKLFGKSVK